MEGSNNKTMVIGDTHGNWVALNKLIEKYRPEVVIQVGDFGIWKSLNDIATIKNGDTKIYFCPGNHENWDILDQFELGKIHEIDKNIFYCAFGSILTLNNKNYLFCGGADSIDKDYRIPGISWWKQEVISYKDMEQLDKVNVPIDIVISHTAPNYFKLNIREIGDYHDCSKDALDVVFDMFHPTEWYFGHFHAHHRGTYKNCEYVMLDCDEAIFI